MPETERLTVEKLSRAMLLAGRLEEHLDWVLHFQQNWELQNKIKVFEAVVWFPHLQGQVNGTNARGLRGKCRDIKIMIWCCAGRCLLQLERDGHRVTLITADDEAPWRREMAHVAPPMGPMGLQSIDADFLEALKLLYEVTRYGKDIQLEPDDNISIG